FECRPVQLFEQKDPAGIGTLTERAVVQPIEQLADGFVEVSQLEELPMAQRCYNPALCHLNSGLYLRLVARFVGPCRNHREGVMFGQLAVGGVQFRLIPAWMLDAGLGVVWDGHLRHSAQELQSADMRADPAGKVL